MPYHWKEVCVAAQWKVDARVQALALDGGYVVSLRGPLLGVKSAQVQLPPGLAYPDVALPATASAVQGHASVPGRKCVCTQVMFVR